MSKDTVQEYLTGQEPVGMTASKIPTVRLAKGNKKGILIKAYGAGDVSENTVPVFIGNAQVTVTSGFPIAPGESISIPIEGAEIYAIASAGSQKIAWITL
jgi:hypothetical protein